MVEEEEGVNSVDGLEEKDLAKAFEGKQFVHKDREQKNSKNVSQFSKLSKEQLSEYGKKGSAIANAKRWHGRALKCADCELVETCERAYAEYYYLQRKADKAENEGNPLHINIEKLRDFDIKKSRCVYELKGRHAVKGEMMRDNLAFLGQDPKNLLYKLQTIFKKIEMNADASPNFAKYAQLYYMLTTLYKLKYGSTAPSTGVNVNVNNSGNANTTVDIKALMADIRAHQTGQDTKPKPEPVSSDEDELKQ